MVNRSWWFNRKYSRLSAAVGAVGVTNGSPFPEKPGSSGFISIGVVSSHTNRSPSVAESWITDVPEG